MMPHCPRSLKSWAIRVTFNVFIAQKMWEVDLGNIKCFILYVTQKWIQIKIGPQSIFLRWSTVLKLLPAIPSFTLWTKGWMHLPTVIWGQSCTPLPGVSCIFFYQRFSCKEHSAQRWLSPANNGMLETADPISQCQQKLSQGSNRWSFSSSEIMWLHSLNLCGWNVKRGKHSDSRI